MSCLRRSDVNLWTVASLTGAYPRGCLSARLAHRDVRNAVSANGVASQSPVTTVATATLAPPPPPPPPPHLPPPFCRASYYKSMQKSHYRLQEVPSSHKKRSHEQRTIKTTLRRSLCSSKEQLTGLCCHCVARALFQCHFFLLKARRKNDAHETVVYVILLVSTAARRERPHALTSTSLQRCAFTTTSCLHTDINLSKSGRTLACE